MHTYEVGKLYHPTRTGWPETTQFNYRSGAYEIVCFWTDPSPEEVNAIRTGPLQFALYIDPPAIFLLYRFAGTDWSDAPYSWWLVPENQRTLPDTKPTEPIMVLLVDAATGILKAIRVIVFPPPFQAALDQAIRDQAGQPQPSPQAYDRHLQRVYARYPQSGWMVAEATVRCEMGGL